MADLIHRFEFKKFFPCDTLGLLKGYTYEANAACQGIFYIKYIQPTKDLIEFIRKNEMYETVIFWYPRNSDTHYSTTDDLFSKKLSMEYAMKYMLKHGVKYND